MPTFINIEKCIFTLFTLLLTFFSLQFTSIMRKSLPIIISFYLIGQIQSDPAMRKMVQRVRKVNNNGPANPAERQEIVINENFRRYKFRPGHFENFLQGDSGSEQPDPKRILLFGREFHKT